MNSHFLITLVEPMNLKRERYISKRSKLEIMREKTISQLQTFISYKHKNSQKSLCIYKGGCLHNRLVPVGSVKNIPIQKKKEKRLNYLQWKHDFHKKYSALLCKLSPSLKFCKKFSIFTFSAKD